MPHPGELLGGRYRLDDRIAAGGMGEVWQATDTVLKRDVAVKTLLADRATDRGFQRRFRHEARALAALRHPGVVTVYDFGSTDAEDAYLVMARVDGEPLNRMLGRRGRLTPAETMSVVAQAAQALEAAHRAGIVHRDVKPGNLLIEPDGTVVLVDFGVARSADSGTVTGAGEVVGTALYIAPEQVARQETGPAADVYALGALAYHCLAGHPPFQGRNPIAIALQHLDDDPPPLPDDIPAGVRAIVRTALSKDPADRFPSAGAMAQAAESAVTSPDTPLNRIGAPKLPANTTVGTGTPADTIAGPDAPADRIEGPGTLADTVAGPDAPADRIDGSGVPAGGEAGAGNAPAGIAGTDASPAGGRSADRTGLAATKAGAPWIGVVGMRAFDTTTGDGASVAGAAETGTAAAETGETAATDFADMGLAATPGRTHPAAPGPTDTGPSATDTADTNPAPAGPAPTDTADTNPAAKEPADTNPAPTDTADANPAATGPGAAGSAAKGAANTSPAATGSAGTSPAPTGPAGTGPADGKPGDAKPGGTGREGGAFGGTARVTRPAAPARTGLLPVTAGEADDRPNRESPADGAAPVDRKRRLLPALILAAVVLLGTAGVIAFTDPFGLFTSDSKPTMNAPAAPVKSAVPSPSAESGGGITDENPAKPETTERTRTPATRSPSPAATRPAETPTTTEPTGEATTGEATTGTTSTPEQTATSPAETDDPGEDVGDPAGEEAV
jgi:tRNA A-37 threonylcarbamoyl transferase component Bud32